MIIDESWDPQRTWQYAERYLGGGTRDYSAYSAHLDIGDRHHPQRGLPRFQVPTFLVPPELGTFLTGELESKVSARYGGADGFLLPVHPETLAFPGLPGRDTLRRAGRGPELTVVPSANARTVFVERIGDEPVEPHFVKLHYPRRLSRFTRRLRRPIITLELWAAAELTRHGLPVLCEVAGGVLGDRPRDAWGFLVREASPRTWGTPSGDPESPPPYTVPLFALYGRDVLRPRHPTLLEQLVARSGEDPALWLARRVVTPMVALWTQAAARTGCALEMHGQNTLFGYDGDGRRTAVFYRDCAVNIDPAIRAGRGLTGPLPPVNVISRDVRQPAPHVFSLVYDSFMAHHALERLAEVAAETLAVDPDLLRQAGGAAFTAYGGPALGLPATVYYYDDELRPDGRWSLRDTGERPRWR
ncbi:ferric iron reductase [Nonomuraea jiangxiensis]|uniref:Ferric iron reductase FhuF-like transporter n=1 Tax=Nonomuraea jiangxiensis TaxID=633440 RepID=A0A1G9BG49_9ACTN|nr:IucA/IucC family C-terminal-domain containing protein [Nonomuraea jiangxiensis]SDK37835.1 Ferric iron reductase FhuF-like transporter [Nonomuraea jiangxiensis]